MGAAAAELADRVVVTSDNPRTERPGDIVDQVLAGIPKEQRGKVVVQVDRARAIRHALEQAAPGDVIVIAGKGHETEQVLPDGSGGTIKVHFDDREVARTMLEEMRPRPEGKPSRQPPRRRA
jgi:UDP-N-acetylmuramoyl-L-alanyl-D-glutamate--2,6-diaminopimelate ligase